MNDSDSLYHQTLLALAKTRQDDAPLLLTEDADGEIVQVRCDNPLCGDVVALSAQIKSAQIRYLAQQTRGCVLCEAATALMMQLAKDAETTKLHTLCKDAETMFASGAKKPEFVIFAPVAAHPARHECVQLPFRALAEILATLRKTALQ